MPSRGRNRGGGGRGRGRRHGHGGGRGRGRRKGKGGGGRGQRPSSKQLIKAIRRACDASDGSGAVAALRRAVENRVMLDATTLQQVVEGFVKCGLYPEARSALLLARQGTVLSPLGLKGILCGIPQVHAMDDAMATGLVDDLCARSSFNAGTAHREYFRTRARWAVLEFVHETRSALENIATKDPGTLERRGRAKLRCTFEKGIKKGELVVRSPSRSQGHGRGFLSGDAVRVAPMDGRWAFEGSIVREMPLIIKLLNPRGNAAALGAAQSGEAWRVDKMANQISFVRSIAALTYLTSLPTDAQAGNGGKKNKQQVTAKNDPRPALPIMTALCSSLSSATLPSPLAPGQLGDICASPVVDSMGRPIQGTGNAESYNGPTAGLNASQRNALAAATSRRVTLVQGPPGTGKTAVAVRILTYWARSGTHSRGAILCASDSNIAVDNMLEGLVKVGVNALRIGRPENTRPELLRYSINSIVDEQLGIGPGRTPAMGGGQMKQARHDALKRTLNHAQVICATCVGAGSGILEKKMFEAVLIDEASQATEIATIIPIIHGCQTLVLVGDHHQLPPTVASDAAKAEGLCLSLFERLVEAGVAPSLLDTQYRMHPAISQFPSDCFYGGAIADGIDAAARPPPAGFAWPRPDWPVAFIPLNDGQESTDGLSKSNRMEAACVVRIVKQLVQAGIPLLEIGIATPYAAQVRVAALPRNITLTLALALTHPCSARYCIGPFVIARVTCGKYIISYSFDVSAVPCNLLISGAHLIGRLAVALPLDRRRRP